MNPNHTSRFGRQAFSIFLTACLMTLTVQLHAADATGRVQDAGTGTPLPGATVQVLGTEVGTAANALGLFRLGDLQPGAYLLEIRFLGYAPQTVSLAIPTSGEPNPVAVAMQPSSLTLSAVQVQPPASGENINELGVVDWQLRPAENGQDMLRLVPGLFLAQHAGGGKAEQLFMRGFDLDHGTDVRINVDGLPVNMVSHAHGQGYADAHFIIPETVDRIDYQQGIGDARNGNFATAGSVDFHCLPAIKQSSIQLEGGSFNNYRALAMVKLLGEGAYQRGHSAYTAGSFRFSDGPFEPAQGLQRYNGLLRYRYRGDNGSILDLTGTAFQSSWSQAGLLAPRAVEQGLVSRFGTLDSAEQGTTSRYNAALAWSLPVGQRNDVFRIKAYGTRYDFDLVSNFTYYLDNPIAGDRIRQTESRFIAGGETGLTLVRDAFGRSAETDLAVGFRADWINDLSLSYIGNGPFNAETMGDPVMDGVGREVNAWVYGRQVIRPARGLRLEGGVRIDDFTMAYQDALQNDRTTRTKKVLVSPRLSAEYAVTPRATLFAQGGKGFHSNDLRVLVAGPDTDPVAPAYGVDLGSQFKPTESVLVKVTAWWLHSTAELVYVGDGGVVEPGDPSRRLGMEVAVRADLPANLNLDADLNAVNARTVGAPSGENFIPLAPWLTSSGGIQYRHPKGFSAALRYRLLTDRPADETGAFTAVGYALLDGTLRYDQDRFSLWVRGENLTNQKWKEAQFLTTSRLFDEAEPVDEVHFTPGFPISVQAGVSIRL